MSGSKFLLIATVALACPLVIAMMAALGSGPAGVERAIVLALGLAPTAITFHFAQWLEKIERTLRIRFVANDRAVSLRMRAGIACSLLALTWSAVIALSTTGGTFDLRWVTLVLGPTLISLTLASHWIGGAVERTLALAQAD